MTTRRVTVSPRRREALAASQPPPRNRRVADPWYKQKVGTRFTPALLLLVFPLAAQNSPLPPRFPLPTPEPFLRKAVQPHKFAEAVGRRAALLGREDGDFEAWIARSRIVRDFRLWLYYDGALEPTPLSSLAELLTVGPGRTTVTHAHEAFTIRQTWFAPLDRPALVVLLDIDAARPMRLRASLVPQMHSSAWIAADHTLALSEPASRAAALVGSPLFTRAGEQSRDRTSEATQLLEMDVTPEIAQKHYIPIVFSASPAGLQAARKIYFDTLGAVEQLVGESESYYRDFQAKTMRIQTPEPVLNRGFEWAKLAIEKGWSCGDDTACGLVAGYGPADAREPAPPAYSGADALIDTWSIVDYGDLDRARAVLELLRDRQRADGRIPDEWAPNSPATYRRGETTPLFLFSAARYVVRSGDQEFLRASWPSVEKAYRFCAAAMDADGLLLNRTGASGVDKDIYLQGAWLAGLDGYAILAGLGQHSQEVEQARQQLDRARKSLDGWFQEDKGYFSFARLGGSADDVPSSWQALALAYGGLDARKSERASESLHRRELSTPWGARLFAGGAGRDNTVWPIATGFVALAEFRHHRWAAGLGHLYGNAELTGFSGAGVVPQFLSGDRAQSPARALPHMLLSSSAVVHPMVRGLLGLGGDAIDGTFSFVPHLPAQWPSLKFELYRIGQSWVSGEVTRQNGTLRIRLTVIGKPLRMYVAPALASGTAIKNLRVNGKKAQAKLETTDADVHAVLETKESTSVDIVFQLREGIETHPELPVFLVGDSANPSSDRSNLARH